MTEAFELCRTIMVNCARCHQCLHVLRMICKNILYIEGYLVFLEAYHELYRLYWFADLLMVLEIDAIFWMQN